jgi:hypothetical protein
MSLATLYASQGCTEFEDRLSEWVYLGGQQLRLAFLMLVGGHGSSSQRAGHAPVRSSACERGWMQVALTAFTAVSVTEVLGWPIPWRGLLSPPHPGGAASDPQNQELDRWRRQANPDRQPSTRPLSWGPVRTATPRHQKPKHTQALRMASPRSPAVRGCWIIHIAF